MALSEKDIHIGKFFQEAKSRAQSKNVPFTITLKYLRDSANDYCPVFGHKFVWGMSGLGKGKTTGQSPSLDRIIPELGYVADNVVFISHDANRIKQDATEKELYAVADWLHEARKNVIKKTTTHLSEGTDSQSKHDAKRRALLAARLGEDRDDAHHHCGTISWEDANHRAQTSGGDSVGTGNAEVGTFKTPDSFQNYGNPYPAATSIKERNKHLSCEFGESGVVVRAGTKVQQSSDRREQSIQGSINQEIQSTQETSQELSTSDHSHWYSDTTRNGRLVESSGHTGSGSTLGDQPHEISGQVSSAGSDEPPHKSSV